MPGRPGGRLGHCAALVVAVGLGLALAGCGGGSGGSASSGASDSSALSLGQTAVVRHTQITGEAAAPTTTLAITALAVRKGTQEELAKAGFQLDASAKSTTPYYVDVRYANKGTESIGRDLSVGLENANGDLITSTTIISVGSAPFAKCPAVSAGQLAPGASYTGCSLFLVPAGSAPAKVSFLPNDPGKETDFVYWNVG